MICWKSKSNKGIIGEQCDSILLFSEEENKNELLDSIIFTIGETGHAKFDCKFHSKFPAVSQTCFHFFNSESGCKIVA